MNDDLFATVAIVILTLLIAVFMGFAIGSTSRENQITVQCEKIGKVIVNDKVYTCRLEEAK